MGHHSQLEIVRVAVRSALAAHGCDAAELRETILIRDGNYCGRRFEAADGHAVWFVEENQIKIYGPDGCVRAIVSGSSGAPQGAKAA